MARCRMCGRICPGTKHKECHIPIYAIHFPLNKWEVIDHGGIISAESKGGKIITYESPPWVLVEEIKRFATVRRSDGSKTDIS